MRCGLSSKFFDNLLLLLIPHDATLARSMQWSFVRPAVRHKTLFYQNDSTYRHSSGKQSRTNAQRLQFSDAKVLGKTPMGHPQHGSEIRRDRFKMVIVEKYINSLYIRNAARKGLSYYGRLELLRTLSNGIIGLCPMTLCNFGAHHIFRTDKAVLKFSR